MTCTKIALVKQLAKATLCLIAGWVLIDLEGCGVCGTDLHILATPPSVAATPGAILGHEGVGELIEIGSAVTTASVGDRVTVAANLTCGLCRYCKAGMPLHCENWTGPRFFSISSTLRLKKGTWSNSCYTFAARGAAGLVIWGRNAERGQAVAADLKSDHCDVRSDFQRKGQGPMTLI